MNSSLSTGFWILTVADVLGFDVEKAAAYLKDFGALSGRGKKIKLKLQSGGVYTLIDDSYSGQPEAMKFAIENLKVSLSVDNAFVITGWDYYDPENMGTSPRIWTFGVNVTL